MSGDFKNRLAGPILVTGGAGYIGGHAVLALQDAGVKPVVLDDLSTGAWQGFHETIKCYEGSVHDQSLVKNIITRYNIRSILHFAGSIQVEESVAKPMKYYHNNTEGSRRLIEIATTCGVENFIFSSTAAVYGKTGDRPVTEDHPRNPLNPYGASKLFTEVQLQDACRVTSMNYGILRYFNVAGADPDLRHGQFLEQPVHLIGRAMNAMLGFAPPLRVFGNDLPTKDGTGVRDYIHVADLVSAHLSLLHTMQSKRRSYLLNLGYGRGSSVLEVIQRLEAVAKMRVPWMFDRPRVGDAPSVFANVDLIQSQLDWKPEFDDIDIIVESAYNWLRKWKGL